MTINQTAIVTGGAGGIGSILSKRLAELGYRVVVADVNKDAAEATVASLPGGTERHIAFAGDLTTGAANTALAKAAADAAPIGVIVNAVGISPKANGSKRPFFDVSEEEWDAVMAVNVKSPFLLIREAFGFMPTDGSASIVNILSITAKVGTGGLPDAVFPPFLPSSIAYAASKAALHNLTVSLSRELVGFKIRVNGVAPGFVSTPMTGVMPDEEKKSMTNQVPMGRFGEPGEIADAIEFLISDKASYITGISLDVNGGWVTC